MPDQSQTTFFIHPCQHSPCESVINSANKMFGREIILNGMDPFNQWSHTTDYFCYQEHHLIDDESIKFFMFSNASFLTINGFKICSQNLETKENSDLTLFVRE